jgi:hypothetical protein
MRPAIFSTKTLQSPADNFEEMRETPRYQIGNFPSSICNSCSKEAFSLSETLEQKNELLKGLALNPDNPSNSNNAAVITEMEDKLASENNKKSSAK